MNIPASLRNLVFKRAQGRCEYCLHPQSASAYRHEPDHIIPVQHEGKTNADNLALACLRCNRYKGPNIGSIDWQTESLVPFFNPRTQSWQNHFQLESAFIRPLTPKGRVTVKILRINNPLRIEERQRLQAVGLYPEE